MNDHGFKKGDKGIVASGCQGVRGAEGAVTHVTKTQLTLFDKSGKMHRRSFTNVSSKTKQRSMITEEQQPPAGVRTNAGASNSRDQRGGGRTNRRVPCAANAAASGLEGAVKDASGRIFQCCSEEAMEKNQLTRVTAEELDTRAGLRFKDHAANTKKMIKLMKDTTVELPKDHNNKDNKAGRMLIHAWEKEADKHVK